jgi:crotonobetaine/carnitine-CoA ligase
MTQTTVLEALEARLAADADGLYLDFEGDTYTAALMDAESTRFARALAARGVTRGDRVATLLENSPEQVLSFFAALKIGAIQVPINTAYKGEFLRHVLADSGAKIVVVHGDFAGRVAEIAKDLPDLTHALVVGEADRSIDVVPATGWGEALEGVGGGELPDPAVGPSDLACLIYTAGTTGPSKGCMLPHNYIVALAHQTARTLQRRPDDVVLSPLPLFHFNAISICVVGTLVIGGASSIARRFSVSRFWPEVKRTNATIVSLLGSLAILIADAEDHPDQHGHRLRLCGAAPMPPATDGRWRERFGCATFSGGFGLTEASLISMLPPGEDNRPGAAGKVNTHDFDVRIVDDDDVEVPTDETGEIVCRPNGPNLMFTGYWRRPEATLAVLRNLWFHTGDLGRVDAEGFLYFVDRKKDYLRRRGENISSFELERVLHGHESVQDVAVHSVPSEQGEDEVKATVVLHPGVRVTEEELCAWCVDKVPYFAVPRYIELRADLPRNPVGRVLKYQLRDEAVTDGTWDREAAGFTFERR